MKTIIQQATFGELTPEFLASLKGKMVGVTASCFDLMHAGHDTMLEESYRELCRRAKSDQEVILITLLQTDPRVDRPEKNAPVQSFEERKTEALNNRYVGHGVPYTREAELKENLKMLLATLGAENLCRFLGEEYEGKQFTGYELGIPLFFNKRAYHGYSTSALRSRVYEAEVAKRARSLEEVPARRRFRLRPAQPQHLKAV